MLNEEVILYARVVFCGNYFHTRMSGFLPSNLLNGFTKLYNGFSVGAAAGNKQSYM